MTAIIIQARMGSTRLPGKIMKRLRGRPMLWHVVNRCSFSKKADEVIVATTKNQEDNVVAEFCKSNGVVCYRGSLENVLERYYETAKQIGADVVVRVTSDCPLIDPEIIDHCIGAFEKSGTDYLSIARPPPFPDGMDVEVFSFSALEKAYQQATENYEREHIIPYMYENKKKEFNIGPMVRVTPEYSRNYRLAVDYPEDFFLMEKIYDEFYQGGAIINLPEVLVFLDRHPELVELNAHCVQKPVK